MNVVSWEHNAMCSDYRTLRCKSNGLYYCILREWSEASDTPSPERVEWYEVFRVDSGTKFFAQFTPSEVDQIM